MDAGLLRAEDDVARGGHPELRRGGHPRPEDRRAHDRESLSRDVLRHVSGNHEAIPAHDRRGLRAAGVAQLSKHPLQRHQLPSCEKTHSLAPVLTHSTSERRERSFVAISVRRDRIPRSRWHVSASPPGDDSIDPRTRAPPSMNWTSSTQPREIRIFRADGRTSSPSSTSRTISSARVRPSRKNRPWHAYDITLSYSFRTETNSF